MANLKDLIINGVSRFIGKVYINNSEIEIINGSTVGNNPKFTDTIYQSKSATSGGTGLSLVTTGQKYIWNQNALYKPVVYISSTQPTGGKTGDIWLRLIDE